MSDQKRDSTTRMKAWECTIGEIDAEHLPPGSDFPMRRAVEEAYYRITGEWPRFIFSGWGAKLGPLQKEIVESTGPDGVMETR